MRAGNGRSANGSHDSVDGGLPIEEMTRELLTLVRTLVAQQAEYPPARLSEAVELLGHVVRDGDDQLAASLESYAARQQHFATEFVRIGAAVDRLPTSLAEQLAEVGDIVSQLFKNVSDEVARIGDAADRLTASIDALEHRLGKPSPLREVLGRLR